MISILNHRFNNIKKNLFPRWDINHQWEITNNNERIFEISDYLNMGFLGYCEKKTKTIFLNLHEDDWKIDLLIVHEICHTFPNCSNHGKFWKSKMFSVSNRCDKLGQYQLADQIRHELENYENC